MTFNWPIYAAAKLVAVVWTLAAAWLAGGLAAACLIVLTVRLLKWLDARRARA